MTTAPPSRARDSFYLLGCLLALVFSLACDKTDDAAKPDAPKPPGTELSTVAGASIKRLADDAKAESSQNWTFNGLDAKAVELEELVVRTLPPDGWMGDAKLPAGRYDVKIDLSGRTPEEMRPTLFKAIESAFGVKLSLTRKDMDGYALRAGEGTPPPALAKADAAEPTNIAESPTGWRFTAVTMDNVADWLADKLGKPVGNASDLGGKYTFDLTAKPDPSTLTAAMKGLGLELTPQRLEQQVLVAEKAQ